ncbi:hypothetical protein [Embleya sp. NPDC001921]
MDESTEQPQVPRVPGVRYRTVKRFRTEIVTIDGISETRQVPYDVLEPMPPRDLDGSLLRGVTSVAIGVTVLAICGTTASIGGLLSGLVPATIAFGIAVVFDVSWLTCIAVEWLERFDRKRAAAPRAAGWMSLLISMAAIVEFGRQHGQVEAGVVGAFVPLLSKGLWWLVMRHHSVELSEAVAFWLARRRETNAATSALAGELRRLDAYDAYARAVYGTGTTARATAITTASPEEPAAGHVAGGIVGPVAPVAAVTPGFVAPGHTVAADGVAPGPVAPVAAGHLAAGHTVATHVVAPVNVAPVAGDRGVAAHHINGVAAAHVAAGHTVSPDVAVSGHAVPTVSAQVTAPPAPPAPPVSGQPEDTTDTPVVGMSEHTDNADPVSNVRQIGSPSVTGIIRLVLAETPQISNKDLTDRVAEVHGLTAQLGSTVGRLRLRIEREMAGKPENKRTAK